MGRPTSLTEALAPYSLPLGAVRHHIRQGVGTYQSDSDSTKVNRASLRNPSLGAYLDVSSMFSFPSKSKAVARATAAMANSPIKQLDCGHLADHSQDLTQLEPNTSAAFDKPAASEPSTT
ncbi:hypothetical protein CSUB01_01968 [Colletotrichum sublineola]|uniref:Uncharacterized protein n=1 Tax=Colletotrichum sublineola TaxID=1173701 RepID=A0A066XC26_COLSU|nr:hypothetical protein CSUB01_01968 [Colletotrichum sublineola]